MSEEKSSFSPEEFQTAVNYAVSKFGEKAIARAFGVSRPTVRRWLKGKNFPFPPMRKGTMKVLKKLLQESQSK